ncbi:alpha/beta hydrolase [Pirellulaceae bacterium]|nr:alpha/beta hydrolase [Pirellulaceae bacterium]
MHSKRSHTPCFHYFLLVILSCGFSNGQSRNPTDLPSLLEFSDGRSVKTQVDFENRKKEIRKLLCEYFVGEFPKLTPKILSAKTLSSQDLTDGSQRKRIRITLNTPHQQSFELALWIPKGHGPFPLLLTAPRFYQRFWAKDALARGYAVCLFPGVDSHHREKDYVGYDSIWEKFRQEYPQATWTEISTKGWLASRCVDYLLSEQSVLKVETGKIAIIGFSRYGKQAMIAAAFDHRITCIVARSPGSPASSPYRLTSRNTFAETPSDFPGNWFLSSLRDFQGREHQLPIDAHAWYALIAPRRCLIHTALNDGSEPTFAVEKAYKEGQKVYQFLNEKNNLRIDYRAGGHSSGPPTEPISAADRRRNLDWIDLSFHRGSATQKEFPEALLHDFNWVQWRAKQDDASLTIAENAPVAKRIQWLLGIPPENLQGMEQPEFLTREESSLMTHDRWMPKEVQRVPIRFGDGVRGNLYFKAGLVSPAPVVVWLHPFSYHSGYNEGYGVQGTTIYHRLAQNGFAVIAYDQCGFGLRLREGRDFYQRYPQWSRLGRMVTDVTAAVSFAVDGKGSYEKAIPKLDPQRVYLLGYSVGALAAMIAGGLDERVTGTACFCGWTPMRSNLNRRLWEEHALLPRLGLYQGNEENLPLDYDDILQRLAQNPCLVVTPARDRFADNQAVADTMAKLTQENRKLLWLSPDDTNRFQAEQHQIFINWIEGLAANKD